MENLKIKYEEKVIRIIKTEGRNVLLFTDYADAKIKDIFAENKCNFIKKLEDNVIHINFENAIKNNNKKLVNNFQFYFIFNKLRDDIKVESSETKRNEYYLKQIKKAFEDNEIEYEELYKLTENEFYTYYPLHTLRQKTKDIVKYHYQKIYYEELLNEYEDIQWRPFQQTVIDLIGGKIELTTKERNRSIYICQESIGDIGKSWLCKYLILKHSIIIAKGKRDNVFNQLKVMMDSGKKPEALILDAPRNDKDFIDYGTLEKLKDGAVYSGKYEGGVCIYKQTLLFIFTNNQIDISMWSKDRIRYIDTNTGTIRTLKEQEEFDDKE
jgi:hypothetical protein